MRRVEIICQRASGIFIRQSLFATIFGDVSKRFDMKNVEDFVADLSYEKLRGVTGGSGCWVMLGTLIHSRRRTRRKRIDMSL